MASFVILLQYTDDVSGVSLVMRLPWDGSTVWPVWFIFQRDSEQQALY